MELKLDQPRINVDFNEMLSPDRVLLSKTDTKLDSEGNTIHLFEGLQVYVYDYDLDSDGNGYNLLADGICITNACTDWSSHVKWVCLINSEGIRHQLEEMEL